MYMYDSKCSCVKGTWYDTIQSMSKSHTSRGGRRERKPIDVCVCMSVCVFVCLCVCLTRGTWSADPWTITVGQRTCVCVWVSEWVHVVVWKACIVKIQHIWPCACVHAHAFARFPSLSSSLVVPVCNTEMARYSSAADTLGLSTLSIE